MRHANDCAAQVRAAGEWCLYEVRRHPLLSTIISGEATKEDYIVFSICMYWSVTRTVPHLQMGLHAALRWGADSAVLTLFEDKIQDEIGHPAMLLSDIENVGIDPGIVDQVAVPKAVTRSTRKLRAACDKGWYCAVIGAGGVREYLSAQLAGEAAEALMKRGKIPGIESGGQSFLSTHGDFDKEHYPSLDESIARLKGETHRRAAVAGAEMEAALFPRTFPRCVSPAARRLIEHFDRLRV